MYSRVETITPKIAEEYLTHNVKNRRIKPNAIARYARDMKCGKWQLSPDGLSFYENGNLCNGQNRLLAVIKAGIPVDFYVTYDVPKENTIQDRGVVRSTTDIMKMSGFESSAATTNGVALVNFLFSVTGRNNASDETIIEFCRDNEAFICDALSAVSSANSISRKAPVVSGAFCALYCGIPKDCVDRFFRVVNSGLSMAPEETAAVILRNFLTQDYHAHTFDNRVLAFCTTLNALRDFANGIPRIKKYPMSKNPAFWKYTKTMVNQYLSEYKDH